MLASEIAQAFGLAEDATDPRWAGTDKRVWRGSGMHDWTYYDHILEGDNRWTYMESWSNGYRAVWSNYAEMSTFTYCEGDLTLVICGTLERFAREMEEGDRFYREYK